MKKILFTFALAVLASTAPHVAATSIQFQEILDDFQEDVASESQDVQEGAEGITLPNFSEDAEEGADIIVLTIRRFLDFFKLIVAPFAVLFAVIMGVRMVSAGQENEEVAGQAKNFIRYALEGLIIIFMSDSIVNVMFGAEGEVFREGQAGVQEFATRSSNLFKGIYTLVQTVIASIAVFVLVMAGMRYVVGSTSDDQIGKAKNQIKWAFVGLFVIGISEFVVKDILFENYGQTLGIESAKELFVDLTNFVSGTLGTLAFVMLIYAGFLYLTASQNEDNAAKAKKIIFAALIGIVIAISAFAITNTFVELDASR
ncbi:hypothetical protein IPG41_07145 [Candidatus Peregrinibacteria bacterium]|nr:MAG: hypothetical protein IPG41_07145 [Candidatus Peregrinibacteria bacterium]